MRARERFQETPAAVNVMQIFRSFKNVNDTRRARTSLALEARVSWFIKSEKVVA